MFATNKSNAGINSQHSDDLPLTSRAKRVMLSDRGEMRDKKNTSFVAKLKSFIVRILTTKNRKDGVLKKFGKFLIIHFFGDSK